MTLNDVYRTRPSLDAWVALTDLYGDDMLTPVHLGQVLNLCGPEPTIQCLKAAPAPLARRIAARWVLEGTTLPTKPPAALLTVLQRLAQGQAVDTRTLYLTSTEARKRHEWLVPTAYDRFSGLLIPDTEAIRQCEFYLLSAWVTCLSPAYRMWNVYNATDKPKAHAILREVIA